MSANDDCFDNCINTYYGDSYHLASNLSPFSFSGAALTTASQLTQEAIFESAESQINRSLWSARDWDAYNTGRRQAGLLNAGRFCGAAAAVVGAAAAGFQLGAWGTCQFRCL